MPTALKTSLIFFLRSSVVSNVFIVVARDFLKVVFAFFKRWCVVLCELLRIFIFNV